MPISDFKDMLTSTISIAPLTGRDGYSKPIHGSPVDYRARISERKVKVRDAQGEEVVADGNILVGDYVNVPPESQVILPDGSTPVVIAVNRVYDEKNLHHTRIFFSRAGGG